MAEDRMIKNRRRAAVAVTAAAVVAAGLAAPVAAGAAPASPTTAPGVATSGRSVSGVSKRHELPAGVPKKGSYAFLLKLNATSTALAQERAKSRGVRAARQAAREQFGRIRSVQADVIGDLPANTSVLYRAQAALAAVAVRTDVKNFAALNDIADVTAVYPISPKKATNATAVPLQKGPQAWVTGSDRGENSTIAIIDSGIDYTHADFGGPGTKTAFATAKSAAQQTDPTVFPTAKVGDGYDFVGDNYDASSQYASAYEPHPDANPLDCDGHGTHVAGTAAGYGVQSGGSTYTGPYDDQTPFDSLKIGPGMAPEATLYAYRVLGCAGTTDVTSAAIERAMDPNDDHDPADHVDVANLSLGSDFGSPEDGDSVMVDAASQAGVTMVVASGNNGDLYDTGGSPGDARSALTVAASQDNGAVVDALNVTSPSGRYAAERSADYPWTTKPDLAGTVYRLSGDNPYGCDPLTGADATNANGKIVFAEWDDADPECGSVARSTNIADAGGKGFVFGSNAESFSAGITGSTTIPGVLVAKSGADEIRTALADGTTVTVGSTEANGVKQDDPTLNDTLADFSSRGIRGAGNVKPDVTAVGSTVFSAAVGTGSDGINESGTSMAAPMTAGLAALVKHLHPTWTPAQVKADIVNTAGQDLFAGPGHTGEEYAPNRVGTGRIDAEAALANPVLAYVKDDPAGVSASFGPLEVTANTVLTKPITLQNTSSAPVTYNVTTQDRTTIPGVTYAVTPTTVTVGAGATRDVTLTLSITKAALTKTIDPTAARAQAGLPRDYLADASGLVQFSPTGPTLPGLRVAYYAAPRPTSTMTQPASLTLPGGAVQASTLTLTGGRIDQGANTTKITSTVAGFELQAISPRLPACSSTVTTGCAHGSDERAGDLKYVGATSSAPQVRAVGDDPLTSADGLAYFAISTYGPWRSPVGFQEYDVYLDTDGDMYADTVVYNDRVEGTDVFVASVVDLTTGDVVDAYPIDDRFGDTDTAVFDSDTLVLPVRLAALGNITAANHRITYAVETYAGAAGLLDTVGSVADDLGMTNGLSFDLLNPGLAVYGSYTGDASPLLYADAPGTKLTVRRDRAAYAADRGKGALLVHFHNAVGKKAQIVSLLSATTTALGVRPNPVTFGGVVTATVTVSSAYGTPTGTVTLKSGTTAVGSAALTGGRATIRFRPRAAGSPALTATYAGNADYAASRSTGVRLTVRRAAPRVTTKLSAKTVRVKKAVAVTGRVSFSGGPVPTGSYALRRITGRTVSGTLVRGSFVKGVATFRFKPKKAGTYRLAIFYGGNGNYTAVRSATVTLKVVKR